MIYFDHNATTPVDERVLDAMLPFYKLFYGNPSSLYRHGRIVRSAIDTAREQVASLVNVHPAQVIFTSGGTEANNLAFTVVKPAQKLAISAVEHPSVSEPAENLANMGCSLIRIGVDSDGLVIDESLHAALLEQPDMVSVMLANNETGVIQDIGSVTAQLKSEKITVHTDAVQALGKIPVDFDALGVDLMTLSSHKIYGPKGCGALVFNKTAKLKPMQLGGGQEQGLRAGTENVPAIVGFGKAAELAGIELAQRTIHQKKLKAMLEKSLKSIPGVHIFAENAKRLPNTVQFSIQGMDGEMLLMQLDQKGIAVSSGSACASGGGKPSPVLAAMGIPAELAKSAIRVSLGKTNTEAEIIQFSNQLKTLARPD